MERSKRVLCLCVMSVFSISLSVPGGVLTASLGAVNSCLAPLVEVSVSFDYITKYQGMDIPAAELEALVSKTAAVIQDLAVCAARGRDVNAMVQPLLSMMKQERQTHGDRLVIILAAAARQVDQDLRSVLFAYLTASGAEDTYQNRLLCSALMSVDEWYKLVVMNGSVAAAMETVTYGNTTYTQAQAGVPGKATTYVDPAQTLPIGEGRVESATFERMLNTKAENVAALFKHWEQAGYISADGTILEAGQNIESIEALSVPEEFSASGLKERIFMLFNESKKDIVHIRQLAARPDYDHFVRSLAEASINLVISSLLGGAGSRWAKEMRANPAVFDKLQDVTGAILGDEKFLTAFKGALACGDNILLGHLIEGAVLSGARGFQLMYSFSNAADGRQMLGKLVSHAAQAALKAFEALPINDFVQPEAPSVCPSPEDIEQYIKLEGKSLKPEDIAAIREYAAAHAGEYVLVSDSQTGRVLAPVLGPCNHYDFVKYFMQFGKFLDVAGNVIGDAYQSYQRGSRASIADLDIMLNLHNQEDLGGFQGLMKAPDGRVHSPARAAINVLNDALREDGGLYDLLAEWDLMGDAQWAAYCVSDDFKARLAGVTGSVIMFAETPGRATGGGLMKLEDPALSDWIACITEKANIKEGQGALVKYTNTNTIYQSFWAMLIQAGIRPCDAVKMLQGRRHGSGVPAEFQKMVSAGVERVTTGIPQRRAVKTVNVTTADGRVLTIPVQRNEQDVHGPLGRFTRMIPFIAESMDTFNAAMTEHDLDYLQGKITFEQLVQEEEAFAPFIGFIPVKNFADLDKARRSQFAMLRCFYRWLGKEDKIRTFTHLKPLDQYDWQAEGLTPAKVYADLAAMGYCLGNPKGDDREKAAAARAMALISRRMPIHDSRTSRMREVLGNTYLDANNISTVYGLVWQLEQIYRVQTTTDAKIYQIYQELKAAFDVLNAGVFALSADQMRMKGVNAGQVEDVLNALAKLAQESVYITDYSLDWLSAVQAASVRLYEAAEGAKTIPSFDIGKLLNLIDVKRAQQIQTELLHSA